MGYKHRYWLMIVAWLWLAINQSALAYAPSAFSSSIQEATNIYDEETKEVHGSAKMSMVVQHQAVEVAKAATWGFNAGVELDIG